MCMMVKKSRVWLSYAKDSLDKYKNNGGDEWLDGACYNCQQSIEFLAKGILLGYGVYFGINGLDKRFGHDISFILEKLDEVGFTFDKHDDLELLSTTLTSWEEKGRYGEGIRTSVQTIYRAFKIYDSMMEAYLISQEENQENKG